MMLEYLSSTHPAEGILSSRIYSCFGYWLGHAAYTDTAISIKSKGNLGGEGGGEGGSGTD